MPTNIGHSQFGFCGMYAIHIFIHSALSLLAMIQELQMSFAMAVSIAPRGYGS